MNTLDLLDIVGRAVFFFALIRKNDALLGTLLPWQDN